MKGHRRPRGPHEVEHCGPALLLEHLVGFIALEYRCPLCDALGTIAVGAAFDVGVGEVEQVAKIPVACGPWLCLVCSPPASDDDPRMDPADFDIFTLVDKADDR